MKAVQLDTTTAGLTLVSFLSYDPRADDKRPAPILGSDGKTFVLLSGKVFPSLDAHTISVKYPIITINKTAFGDEKTRVFIGDFLLRPLNDSIL